MASNLRPCRSQSTDDFNSASKVAHDRREREQEDQQTRRRTVSAAPLPSPHRQLPPDPWQQVDSGAHSLQSSTGDLDLSPDGELLIQNLKKAVSSGEKSARDLRTVEAERDALRNENRQLRQALDGINARLVRMCKGYLDIAPNEVLKKLEEMKTSTNLDLNALSSTAHNGDHRSRSSRDASTRTNSGKHSQQPRRSGTDADVESISSSSSNESYSPKPPNSPGANGFQSDDMQSSKEEGGIVPHQGTSEIAPVHTDVD